VLGRRECDELRISESEWRQEIFEGAEEDTIDQKDRVEGRESFQEPTIEVPAGDSAQTEADFQSPQSPIPTQADRKAERAEKKEKNKIDGKKEQKQSNLE
jgi:hypothetical protein